MKFSKFILLFYVIFSFHVFASTESEIKHLLAYVEATDCQYERNGTMHSGADAVKHINKKYRYYSDDIESSEDFIKLSATKSTMSGKSYKIHCQNQMPIKSQDWLLTELHAFRQRQ
ncbi:MAG: DUF5329 family protein [Cognaticolwellia sp.]